MRSVAVIYLVDDDPILCELDSTPAPTAQYVIVHQPRRRDGRNTPLLEGANDTVLIAWHRIRYIQILPQGGVDTVIGFVRE